MALRPVPDRPDHSDWDDHDLDGWDFDAFHIKSTNEHDHSLPLNIPRTYRFPAQLVAQMEHWIAEDVTSYRSLADVIRDAVVHRMQYLAEREGHTDYMNVNGFLAFESRIAFEEAIEQDMADMVLRMKGRAKALHERNDAAGLIRLWETARATSVDPMYVDEWQEFIASAEAEIEEWTKGIKGRDDE